jgi:cobalt-zinc-cadmium efflux system protein
VATWNLMHAHAHAHAGSRAGERRRLALTVALTALILVAEVVGGLLSRSLALLSDAGHMFTDVVAQGLALAAMYIAARPADERRTYGWHRIEILAALVNGITLFALSSAILWQAWRRLGAPVEVHTGLLLIVATVGLFANLVGTAVLRGLHSLNARAAYLHVLLDTLSSVAVLAGGVVMYVKRGLYWVDPALSIAIGLLIFYNSYRLIREAVDVLLETVPRGIDLAGVTHAIDRVDGVAGVHDLHIWTITSGLYALSAHIVVAPEHEAGRDQLLNRVKEMLLSQYCIAHTTLQIESEGHEHVGHVC